MMGPEIPLSAPEITESDREAVMEVLRGPHLSRGPWINRFEAAISGVAGRREAVAVSSGTAALHLAGMLAGLGRGDEVLTTPFSFIASANVILHCGATPVFVDIDPATLNLDVGRLEECITERTRAILAVHAFGRPAEMDRLKVLARAHDLLLIEDACESLGGTWAGRPLGSFGDFGAFGFYPNKQITAGEGGVLLTDDSHLAVRARRLRNQGRDPDGSGYSELGYNYRWTDIQAALALSQLTRLGPILERRREVADGYRTRLEGCSSLVLPEGDAGMSWFVFVVRLSDEIDAGVRDRVLRQLRARGIGCGAYFPPIHTQPFYRERFGYRDGDFPITERIAARTLALPFFNRISGAQQDRVVDTLVGILGSLL
jgi:dTDP-4-amino-4,6-dideoxygalactose transaminase